MTKKLTEEELKIIQDLNNEFGQVKIQLADGVIIQHDLVARSHKIKQEFQKTEAELTKKYGKNATINLQTGAVTDPPKEEEKKEEPKAETKVEETK